MKHLSTYDCDSIFIPLRHSLWGIVIVLGCLLHSKTAHSQQPMFSNEVLENPRLYGEGFENIFNTEEIPIFSRQPQPNTVILENGYASSIIRQPGLWPPSSDSIRVTEVKVIYTKYPKDKAFWLTNYHDLLARRLQALFELDSSLNDQSISWSIVLQTDCDNELEAQQLFHGISISYFPVPSEEELRKRDTLSKAKQMTASLPIDASRQVKKVKRFINKTGGFTDSTTYKTLDRNSAWKNTLIVMDWTGSMYPYGGQAVLWHATHLDSSGIGYFAFFNDGNNKKRKHKKVGETGGIYFQEADQLSKVVRLFNKVSARGQGGDQPENDLEAIIKAIEHFDQQFDHVVLIADNLSCIRDFSLIEEIGVPVRIILCGTFSGINHQYINLAYKTGGSIHTIEDDYFDLPSHLVEGSLVLGENRYMLDKYGFFYPTNDDLSDFNYCNKYYHFRSKNGRSFNIFRRNTP